MRLLIPLILSVCIFSTSANAADGISPGMPLGAVVEALEDHDYEVDSLKYGLQIDSDDENVALEFCRIDEEITLVLEYAVDTKKVSSMWIYAIPRIRTSRLQNVVREVATMKFDKDGFYTLKLSRRADARKSASD